MDNLGEMVEKARALWPNLAYQRSHDGASDRAQAAANLVSDGLVEYAGETSTGLDRWIVSGHHCSIKGRSCDCQDRQAPVDPKLGRLCKHRLAAMFSHRLQQAQQGTLAALFSQACRQVVLEVRTYYRSSLAGQVSRLVGWRIDDAGWRRVKSRDEELQFRIQDLEHILAETGWRVAARLVVDRHPGGRERWTFEPMPAAARRDRADIATAIGILYGRDGAMAEEHNQRRRLTAMVEGNHER